MPGKSVSSRDISSTPRLTKEDADEEMTESDGETTVEMIEEQEEEEMDESSDQDDFEKLEKANRILLKLTFHYMYKLDEVPVT